MRKLRQLFAEAGMLSSTDADALKVTGVDPWQARCAGLERPLQPVEFAVALGHIARHRGFRSNSKRDHGANAASDTSKMLKAIENTRDRLSKYRTVGQMLGTDPEFAGRKRNRDGEFSRTILRSDLEDEVRLLFTRQRELGVACATPDLEAKYTEIAFYQRPLADSLDKVGLCPFEPGERRAAKHSRTFELFRFLARLTSLRVGAGRNYRALTEEEVRRAASDFGKTKSMTFNRLRKLLDFEDERFQGVSPIDEKKRDVVARTGSAAEGTVTLKECIGAAAWAMLTASPEMLDRIGEILAFIETPERIRKELDLIQLSPAVMDAIMVGVEDGRFAKFRGAGHISARAARNIIPHLLHGLTYDKACAAAGYRHTDRVEADITNPVARKAVLEGEKQVRAIVNDFRQQYGDKHWAPDRIHVELARDIGKSAEERKKIETGIEERNKEKDKLRDTEFPAAVGQEPHGPGDLLRFELWKEQNGRCMYCDGNISPNHIVASDNAIQVDHILPWSRFGDDSFHNRTLCHASCNQEKRGRTPFEWFREAKSEKEWEEYQARVENAKALRGMKKRNYLLRNAEEVEERFRARNLNDTRYAARVLLERLKRFYPTEDGTERVFARPGALTGKLRRAWGVDTLKKDPLSGKRVDDDRHHAIDAIVLAATTQSALQRLTKAFQEAERKGLAREFEGFALPWPTFVEDARATYDKVFVSRAERRRARGKAHDATIKQVREIEGKSVVYERKSIDKLTEADLARIPVPAPYGKVADPKKLRDEMVEALRKWILANKPKDERPLSPRGDEIRKVRLATTDKVAVTVRDGTADRGDMARVDVFQKSTAGGKRQFFLVPIYPHEIATLPQPPTLAVQGGGDQSRWPVIDVSYEFLWSIYPMSLVELTKPDGEIILGYHRSLDRNTGALTVSSANSLTSIRKGIGARTLIGFRKLTTDRLGRVFEVPRERRTWRGEVCT